LSAFRAPKCHRKSIVSGASNDFFGRSSRILGRAQIQLDGAQIQLEYATRLRLFDSDRFA
jgi:hypothetical protein